MENHNMIKELVVQLRQEKEKQGLAKSFDRVHDINILKLTSYRAEMLTRNNKNVTAQWQDDDPFEPQPSCGALKKKRKSNKGAMCKVVGNNDLMYDFHNMYKMLV